jgi:dCMP deaminase
MKKNKAKKPKKDKKHIRPSWDEYFMNIAEMVGSRGTCDRGRTGCVVVKDKRILCTGYAGAPVGLPHCDEVGHEMHTIINEDGTTSRHCIRTSHAEQNAIAQAARMGIALEGSTIYMLMSPCYVCAKILINAGIKRVVTRFDYHTGKRSREIFKEAGVEYELLNNKMQRYKDM